MSIYRKDSSRGFSLCSILIVILFLILILIVILLLSLSSNSLYETHDDAPTIKTADEDQERIRQDPEPSRIGRENTSFGEGLLTPPFDRP